MNVLKVLEINSPKKLGATLVRSAGEFISMWVPGVGNNIVKMADKGEGYTKADLARIKQLVREAYLKSQKLMDEANKQESITDQVGSMRTGSSAQRASLNRYKSETRSKEKLTNLKEQANKASFAASMLDTASTDAGSTKKTVKNFEDAQKIIRNMDK